MINRLFHDINLTVKWKSAYRTSTRAHGNPVGVLIAELYSIEDKRSVLERKQNLKTNPIYCMLTFSSEQQNSHRASDGI